MKYTIGIRLEEDEELRGSDEVEHNIVDQDETGEAKKSKSLGRKVVRHRTLSNVKPEEGEINGTANPNADVQIVLDEPV